MYAKKGVDTYIVAFFGSEFVAYRCIHQLDYPIHQLDYPMNWYLRAIGLVSIIAAELPGIVADGRITISEVLSLAVKVSRQLGFDVDDEGLELAPKKS